MLCVLDDICCSVLCPVCVCVCVCVCVVCVCVVCVMCVCVCETVTVLLFIQSGRTNGGVSSYKIGELFVLICVSVCLTD